MKPQLVGIIGPQGKIQAASKGLLGVVLAFVALPCLLSAQTLQHRYSFVSDASDSVGGANGTVVGPTTGTAVTINNGLLLPGGGGPGFSGYVTLPAGILNTTTNVTIECWATQNSQDNWAELWNFNNGTGQYFGYIPYPQNNNNNMSLVDKNGSESDAFSGVKFPNGVEEHVTAEFNVTNLQESLFLGPNLIASAVTPNSSYTPGTYNTANNFLGQDPWPDAQWQGTLYEFRIYNGILTPFQIAVDDVAGPTNFVSNFTPTSAVFLTSSTNLVITGTAQAAVDVTLAATTTNVFNAASIATNWISSNPAVLQVNPTTGVIVGVGLGNATVRATVNGVTATSPTIFVTAAQTLVHRYSFIADASDSVGGANGTIVPPSTNATAVAATISNGLMLPGGGGPGFSGYVTLPAGILTNTTSSTIECWVTQNQGNTWAQIFNFGNSQSQNMGLIPLPGRDGGNLELGINPSGNEIDTISPIHFPTNSEQYIAFTFNNATLTSGLYDNGNLLATRNFPSGAYMPGILGGPGGTTNNVFGQDPYPDLQFQGTIYEFRIWNGAVAPVYLEVSAAAGPSVVVTNFTPTSLTLNVTNLSMIGSQVQQATVTGNFTEASGVNVTGGATNWVSSNPSVLTVNQSGQITAVSGGAATVSATVSGVSATSATITVATTPPTISQYPANVIAALGDTVNFSVVAFGGSLNYQWSFDSTPISGATNASLTVPNVGFASAGTYSVLISNTAGSSNVTATLVVNQAVLKHRYSFATDASDSVGGPQWNGILVPRGNTNGSPATISNGLSLPGGGGGGYSGYVAFPSGIITNTSSITVEAWVTQNTANGWATVWDFANNGGQNFELCPFPLRNINNLDVAITPNGGEIDTVTGSPFPSGVEVYTAFTFNAATLTGTIYTNGFLSGVQAYPNATYIPGTIGGAAGTAQNWLGNDTYGDTQFQGTIYEFRIWDGAVSPLYLAVSAVAGPSVVVTNLTPTAVAISVTNSTMIQGLSQPATVTANFTEASGIVVTSSATNWISSNTGVLTVNASGQVTAVGTGSATISATVNGVTGTSASISVPPSAPIITQQPATNDIFLQGATLTASVSTIGTTPIVYRWFFNGGATPISTSLSPTLAIPNVQPGNAGTYTVLASNLDGSILSSNLVVSIMTPSPYETTVLQYGPVAYWPLQETSGTIAYDVVGADNGTYMTTSASGSSYSLNQSGPSQAFFGGSSAAVQFVSAIADIPVGQLNITGPITVTLWVQVLTPAQFASIVGHGDNSWRISITENGLAGGALAGGNDGGSAADATAPTSDNINDASWHMLVYTYNGSPGHANNGSLYQDGVLVANNTITAAPAGGNLDVWIGGSPDYGTGRLLTDANVAHVAVFNQAFTAAQVQGLYTNAFVLGPQTLHITQAAPNVVLTWGAGTLLQSTNVNGPWTTNSAATSPYSLPATGTEQFFRLLVNP
ncbi:MAG TPA: LamG-like jellyroll fold domain-containing protein [Verrucomicrobiae bacterium]|nr:LamG-like jellyroll fold domain-containing protein [Verrucomicrobiae bacterium]